MSKKHARLDDQGREIPDPTPMAPPVGFVKQAHLWETLRMKQLIRSEALAMMAEREGFESFEEADDFDIPDDPIDPTSPYEDVFDPHPLPPRMTQQAPQTGSQPPQAARETVDGPAAPTGSEPPTPPASASPAPAKP